MVVKKAWMAMATLLAFAALPACATSNAGTTGTSSGTGGEVGAGGGTSTSASSSGTGGKVVACGDGEIANTESCDDGNTADGDGCNAKCELEMGWDCTGTDKTVCVAKCGDGFLVGKEACDDGNSTKSDGCSDTCTVDNGYACTGAPSSCATVCGDGILAGKEECDNGNATAGDGCSELCKVETGWTCTGQPSTCKTTCGDGVIAGAEACDDHNFAVGDGCDAACLIEANWTCTGVPSACVTVCGDGNILGTEVCDDGNVTAGDGCSLACTPEPGFTCTGMPSKCVATCGDGVQVVGVELCDDGNTSNGDGCNAVCKLEFGFICTGTMPTKCNTVCGDGYAAGTETCDVGPPKPNDGCDDNCHAEHGYVCNNFPSVCNTVCGDGLKGGTEACDTGGVGPGCSLSCAVLPGYTCSGEPSVCITTCGDGVQAGNETCDDGNLANGDCCSDVCGAEAGCEVEANNAIPTANDFNTLAISTTVKGTIKPAGDLDYYVITIPAGQTVVLNAATLDGFNSSCVNLTQDSFLTVYDVNGVALGSDDNSGPGNCAQLQVIGLTAGDYFVEVKAGANTPVFSYALTIQLQIVICGNGTKEPGEQCDDGNVVNGDGCSSTCHFEVANEIEPNNTPAQALANGSFPFNQLWAGAITPLADNDYYLITIPTTSDLRIETFDGNGPGSCVTIDTQIYLYASNGTTQLATDDDLGINFCSLIDSTNPSFPGARHLAPGNYYVRVHRLSDSQVIGAYDVVVTFNAVCGNGILEGAEQCDGGANCSGNCDILPTCGDNFISVGEQCEDGNTVSGDGCSSTCQFEPGYTCTATLPNVCTKIINCPAPGQLFVYNATGLPLPINDNLTTTSTLNVSAVGTVKQAIIQLNITHTWDSDLNLTLKSPTVPVGIDLSSGNGSSGDNYTNTLFSDNCVPVITSGTAPFSGCYHPEGSLASFINQPASGTWTLTATDTATGDTGTLTSWQLTLCVQ
jgi:cysteine-rich repeat protein